MAIRRPALSSPEWLFQDFLYQKNADSEDRYLQVKWSGEVFERLSQTYDYSDPPFSGTEQRGGEIVAQINYNVDKANLVTINSWYVNWRDDYPLRLAIIHLRNCLYPYYRYGIRVQGDEVYKPDGTAVAAPKKDPFAFWVSEEFSPTSNVPNDYLISSTPFNPPAPNPTPPEYYFTSSVITVGTQNYILVTIDTKNVPYNTYLYWKLVEDVAPPVLTEEATEGVIYIDDKTETVRINLNTPLPGPGPYLATVTFYSDPQRTVPVGSTFVYVYNPPEPPVLNSPKLGAYIELWQYRNTDAAYPFTENSGWNPVVRASNIANAAVPLLDHFFLLANVQLNGDDSLLYFGNPAGFPAAAQVLNSTGTDWNTNTGSDQGTYVDPTNPDYVYSAWALKNTIAYMNSENVDRNKFLLCVGGYLLSNNMDLAGATPEAAAKAASQLVTLMNLCGAKGIDIDYEPVGIPASPDRMSTLMQAVYTAVKAVNPNYEVHLTIIPSILQSDPDQKIATAVACSAYTDQINVMTYDDPSTLGQPLYEPGNIPVYNHSGVARSVESVVWFIEAGVPPNKLGMGIALYGRNSASPSAAFDPQNPVPYSQVVASADAAGQTTNSFTLGRYEGSVNIQNPSPTGPSDYYGPAYTALWGFDSVDTVAAKVQEAANRSLRGVFAWQISNDYANTSSSAPAGDARANFALLSAARVAIDNL